MPITDEQAKYIKEQIAKQVESFPAEKREEILAYIGKMNNEELEEFLIKNKMIKQPGQEGTESEGSEEASDNENKPAQQKRTTECIMCLISSKQVESLVIYEDKDYLAALEINPMSNGHVILIPKKHLKETKELKPKAFTIATKIGKHLVKKLEAENFQINSSDELQHAIINIIPKYKGQPIDFKRKPAKKEDLQALAKKIGIIKTPVKRIKIKTEKSQEKAEAKKEDKEKVKINILKLPRRIP